MPQRDYDIQLRAVITFGGKFSADSAEEAKETAIAEMRSHGEITDIDIERCLYLDPQEDEYHEPPDILLSGSPDQD